MTIMKTTVGIIFFNNYDNNNNNKKYIRRMEITIKLRKVIAIKQHNNNKKKDCTDKPSKFHMTA